MIPIRLLRRPGTRVWVLVAATALLLLPSGIVLSAEGDSSLAWGEMTMNLLGGLALFLFGMTQMADALKAAAGERMKLILAKLTSNRLMGVATGAFVTAVIQSSSVTTVLVVGFITAGLMSLSQSIGVIMGANIGTTITAQIVAFKVTKLALLMVAVGFSMMSFSQRERVRHYGAVVMGLGLVFFGMAVMSDAMQPLRGYQPFLDLMAGMDNPLVGIVIAAAFTALIQSSSATTAIVILMASQGFITLAAGIALAFGANIGTCVTALLAAIGRPREAVRAALAHIFFNVAGVVLWLGFIDYLAELVVVLSPAYPELTGVQRAAAETPRQIANAHTFFNVANTFIFIGFSAQIGRLIEFLVPDRPLTFEDAVVRPKYLADELLETPTLALDRVRLELLHMGEYVEEMLRDVLPAILSRDDRTLDDIAARDNCVDILHASIIDYLGKVSKLPLTEKQTDQFIRLMAAANDLENVGDIIETNLVALGRKVQEVRVKVSEPTRDVLTNLHAVVSRALTNAIQAVTQDNEPLATAVVDMKDEINRLTDSAALHEIKRLVAEEPGRIAAYTVEMDIIEKLKRVYYFAKRISKTVVPDVMPEKPI